MRGGANAKSGKLATFSRRCKVWSVPGICPMGFLKFRRVFRLDPLALQKGLVEYLSDVTSGTSPLMARRFRVRAEAHRPWVKLVDWPIACEAEGRSNGGLPKDFEGYLAPSFRQG